MPKPGTAKLAISSSNSRKRLHMESDTLPAYVRFLLSPTSYPHQVENIRLVQTHISYVFIAGDMVYKFKKPVNFGFLDFTTLERRLLFCEQELALNRRLCPSIYLGTVTVNRAGDSFVLNGAGDVVEHGIKMRRMPEEGMMANFIRSGRLTPVMLERIVSMLVPFYETADGGEQIREFGRARAVAVNVLENFDQTEGFVGCPALSREQFETITNSARNFLAREDLFEQRVAAGRIRECHGDLYSANICFDVETVHIFDCIEFNERFRFCDVASDIAFLAMDLDFHGLEELSSLFIKQFQKASGDATLARMLPFYKCYRAYVRGKIGLFTAHAPEVDAATREQSLAMAGRYFQLATQYAR